MKTRLLRYSLAAASLAASLLLAGCYTQLALQGDNDSPPDIGTEAPPVYYPVYVPEPAPPVIVVVPSGSYGQTNVSAPPQRTSGVRRAEDANDASNTRNDASRTSRTEAGSARTSNVAPAAPSTPTPGSNRSTGATRSGR